MDSKDISPFDRVRINKPVSENEVIDILLNWHGDREKTDLRAFISGIFYPDPKAYFDYEGFYVTKTILRDELKLEKGKKPGDVDVIIIPFNKTKIYFERTSVYEIKIVHPTRKNLGRNANSLGVTQVLGLIEDGFPLIGLIHISVTEPLVEEEKMDIKFSTLQANSGKGLEKGRKLEDYLVDVKLDQFSWWSSENQVKRLIAQKLPEFIGISTFGLEFYEDNIIGLYITDVCHKEIATCCLNPQTSSLIILKIKNHFLRNKNKYKLVLNRIPGG